MKAGNIVFKFAVLLAALAAGYAFGFAKGSVGSHTAKEKPADIAAMRMALAEKQAQACRTGRADLVGRAASECGRRSRLPMGARRCGSAGG